MEPSPDTRVFSKWRPVVAFWLVQTAFAYVLPLLILHDRSGPNLSSLVDGDYALTIATWIGVLTALQALFLWPVRRPAPRMKRGVPLWLSMSVAGLVLAVLVAGLAGALVDVLWLVGDAPPDGDDDLQGLVPWAILTAGLMSWFVATPLLVAFCCRHRRETLLGRLSARLFLGTLVEVAAVIPLDVMVRRKTNCYCEQGTFWALIGCTSVGVFTLGPAIFMPVLARRRKRWYAGHCDACGYDMSGTPAADRCPECGAGWRPEAGPGPR